MLPQDHEQWHWQEPGKAWKGVGIYHVTLTVPTREPLLGKLVIPGNDPIQAYVKASHLGLALLDCLKSVPAYHPEIQVLQYCLMPDHLHAIWYVRQTMDTSIRYVAQGFMRAAKKIGRAYSYIRLSDGTMNEILLSSVVSAGSREDPLRERIGEEAYKHLPPIFNERPFVRPLSRKGQLRTMIRYIDMNPQRLATKHLMPDYFRVQDHIEIAGRIYSGVGNADLLQRTKYMPVHVRSTMIDEAIHGDDRRLNAYMDSCVEAAQKGAVMVSPFIHEKEREVLYSVLADGGKVIYLADNGFGEYYKPSAGIFEAVANKQVLILSPWEYDPKKKGVTRAECVAMNKMAEEICSF